MSTSQAPYAAQTQPPKKKHTARNVLLVVVGLSVLLIGGCMALIGGVASEVDKAIDADANKAGGTDNPMKIEPGKAFEVDGFKYASGWALKQDAVGDAEVAGLKVTNERDGRDSALVEIKLWRGSEVVALIDCTTEPIQTGTTVTLGCFSADDMPKKYDKVTINDAF